MRAWREAGWCCCRPAHAPRAALPPRPSLPPQALRALNLEPTRLCKHVYANVCSASGLSTAALVVGALAQAALAAVAAADGGGSGVGDLAALRKELAAALEWMSAK